MSEEKLDELIDEFGEQFVRRYYFLCGTESASPAALYRRMNKRFAMKYFEDGCSNPFVAHKLGLSVRTVQRYREEFDGKKKK